MVAVPVTPVRVSVTVMVAVPTPVAVTVPSLTTATLASLVDQVSWVSQYQGSGVTARVTELPSSKATSLGDTFRAWRSVSGHSSWLVSKNSRPTTSALPAMAPQLSMVQVPDSSWLRAYSWP